jgi:hypothetical protein
MARLVEAGPIDEVKDEHVSVRPLGPIQALVPAEVVVSKMSDPFEPKVTRSVTAAVGHAAKGIQAFSSSIALEEEKPARCDCIG